MTVDETDAPTQNRGKRQNRQIRVVDELPASETGQIQRASRTNFAVKRATVVLVLLALAALGSLLGGEVKNQRQIARLIAGIATGTSQSDWARDIGVSSIHWNETNATTLNADATIDYTSWTENL